MPQLDLATFPPQLIWLAITFLVLYVLMAKLGLPRIDRALKARRTRIEDDLDKARQMKAEAEAVIAAYERALAEARQQAQLTLKETTDRLNAEAAQRQRATAEALAGETAAAERRIVEAKAAATKLTGAKIDAGQAAAAIERAMRERQ